jgi:hypothetical protein
LANPSLTSERVVDRTPTPKSPGIPFYNPRRSYPYWTSSALKHKSYQEAIKTLAQEYGKSSQWIQRHMGNSNDLTQIHENLSKAK